MTCQVEPLMDDRKKFLGMAVIAISAIIVMKVSMFTGVLMLIGLAIVVGALATKR